MANLYYNQPLLTQLQHTFGVDVDTVGRVPMLTQLGYACGMLLLTPMGDRMNRRTLILFTSLAVSAALLAAAFAQSFFVFELASLAIGATAVGAQVILPHVAHLSPDATRGAAVGKVLTGLLLGILLARTASGALGDAFGWRAVFMASAGLMLALTLSLAILLPGSEASFRGSYLSLLRSIVVLLKEEPVLRQCSAIGCFLFASFSAPWASLIFLLSSPPYHYGAKETGLFGLVGAAGALAAAFVGKLADRKGALTTSRAALLITVLSFGLLALGSHLLWAVGLGLFLMDAGVQAAHVSNQSRFYRLRPDARSRLNTAYMFFYFVGGAFGSFAGSVAWKHAGWAGVCAFCAASSGVALLIALRAKERISS